MRPLRTCMIERVNLSADVLALVPINGSTSSEQLDRCSELYSVFKARGCRRASFERSSASTRGTQIQELVTVFQSGGSENQYRRCGTSTPPRPRARQVRHKLTF